MCMMSLQNTGMDRRSGFSGNLTGSGQDKVTIIIIDNDHLFSMPRMIKWWSRYRSEKDTGYEGSLL